MNPANSLAQLKSIATRLSQIPKREATDATSLKLDAYKLISFLIRYLETIPSIDPASINVLFELEINFAVLAELPYENSQLNHDRRRTLRGLIHDKLESVYADYLRTKQESPSQANDISFPSGADDELLLSVDPGSAEPEEIAEILAEISRIYRKIGGSGISFRLDDVTVREEEVV